METPGPGLRRRPSPWRPGVQLRLYFSSRALGHGDWRGSVSRPCAQTSQLHGHRIMGRRGRAQKGKSADLKNRDSDLPFHPVLSQTRCPGSWSVSHVELRSPPALPGNFHKFIFLLVLKFSGFRQLLVLSIARPTVLRLEGSRGPSWSRIMILIVIIWLGMERSIRGCG